MNICLFEKDELGKSIPLRDERAQHLIKVLHKKCGDTFFAGVKEGEAGTATITRIGSKADADGGSIDFIFEPVPNMDKPLLPITLIVGFPRPIQLRRLLRDVAGIGCEKIFLTGTELGDKSYLKSTLVEKGAAVQMLVDGTVQAASTHVPKIKMHKTLSDCLADVNGDFRIALDNVRAETSLAHFLRERESQKKIQRSGKRCEEYVECDKDKTCGQKIIAAIGSERGWTDKERDLLKRHGFTLCSMGERVLRTETAATAATAVIASHLQLSCPCT